MKLPTPVMAIDKDFSVTFMNAAGAGVLGSTPEQVIGQKCFNLFKTSHCQTAECRCAQAMQKDEACTGETVADPDGLNLPIQYTGTPIKVLIVTGGGAHDYKTQATILPEVIKTRGDFKVDVIGPNWGKAKEARVDKKRQG